MMAMLDASDTIKQSMKVSGSMELRFERTSLLFDPLTVSNITKVALQDKEKKQVSHSY